MALHALCEYIKRHKAEGTPVVLISLDFRGAFDSVWRPLVIKYFRDRGCSANLVGLLGTFLEGRTVEYASHAGSVSAETSIGSPQGSPISPLLWNVIVDGLLRLPMPAGVRVQAYADDTIVLVPGKNRARVMEAAAEAMRRIEEWTAGCKLALNNDKTFCVLFSFGKGGMEKSHPTIRLKGSARGLPFRTSIRLLGVVVDRRLSFFEHAEHLQRKAETLAIKSLSFLRMHTTVDSAMRRRLYRQVLLPAVAYASPDMRTMLLAITGAYRTTRTAALQVLANQPPIGLELDRLNAEFALFRMRQTVTFGAHTFAPDETQYPHDPWGAHPSEARGFPFARLDVTAARAWSSAPGTHVYTDGSYTSSSAGAAVVVLKPRGSIVAVRKYRLTVASSAYCAEVVALTEALNYLDTHAWEPPAHIYVDNLSLLAALCNVVTRDARVANIKSALYRLQRRGALTLFHVPSHRGIFGNELADMAAGAAAISGMDRRSHRSFRVVRAAFSAAVRARWAVEWRGEHSDTELCKWVPDITHIPRDFPPPRRLACLLTAHGRFPYYFHRFRISQDMRCPCGATCRDARHFFESCALTAAIVERIRASGGALAPSDYPRLLRDRTACSLLGEMVGIISDHMPDHGGVGMAQDAWRPRRPPRRAPDVSQLLGVPPEGLRPRVPWRWGRPRRPPPLFVSTDGEGTCRAAEATTPSRVSRRETPPKSAAAPADHRNGSAYRCGVPTHRRPTTTPGVFLALGIGDAEPPGDARPLGRLDGVSGGVRNCRW
ncbi:uncharacterized protein LOC142563446 [Dermacentor variabilis]|uniref:uncharacterized protein LOC142563446 n=1 Tax=Dermacentor variabilis TaxID=34621 RepID=UPI003F5BB051